MLGSLMRGTDPHAAMRLHVRWKRHDEPLEDPTGKTDETVREITSSVDTSNGNCGESVYKWEFDKGDASLEIAANGSLL
jgi:hypothetical protein